MWRETHVEMDEELLKRVESNTMRCARCGLIIPFIFKKGPEYTCPSFTLVEGEPVCYYCYHPEDYEAQIAKRRERK